jgi:hypothetical protein
VPKGTTDRLQGVPVQPAKNGNAMRVEVRHGDIAWNPHANNGNGAPIPGGWRAEALGPTEPEGARPLRYQWSTMLDPGYVSNPRVDDPTDPNNGKPIWQVIFQWHQGDTDRGSSPPVAFTILRDNILLDVHRHDPANEARSIQVGQWAVANLERGLWHDFTAEIRWHPTDGSIKVWHNGQPVTFAPQVPPNDPGQPQYPPQPTDTLTGLGTLFPPQTGSSKPSSAYMKAGLYRKGVNTTPAGPFILYHDELFRYEQGMLIGPIPTAWSKLIPKLKLPKWFPRPPWPPPWPPFSRRRGQG